MNGNFNRGNQKLEIRGSNGIEYLTLFHHRFIKSRFELFGRQCLNSRDRLASDFGTQHCRFEARRWWSFYVIFGPQKTTFASSVSSLVRVMERSGVGCARSLRLTHLFISTSEIISGIIYSFISLVEINRWDWVFASHVLYLTFVQVWVNKWNNPHLWWNKSILESRVENLEAELSDSNDTFANHLTFDLFNKLNY